MDFRPNTNTLVINYVVTFGVVGGLLFLSVNKPTRYYYSPDHTSHAGYGPSGSQSCKQCHIKPWTAFEEKTCWTTGCHTSFDSGAGPADTKILSTRTDEFGNPKPHFGAMVAFHRQIGPKVSCETCHPSHKLPQSGAFNVTTINQELLERAAKRPVKSNEERNALKTEIFHAQAEKFTGKVSCQTCHVEALIAEEGSGIAAASATPSPFPPPDQTAPSPGTASGLPTLSPPGTSEGTPLPDSAMPTPVPTAPPSGAGMVNLGQIIQQSSSSPPPQ